MALKPYQQTTALSPLPGPVRTADTRVIDLGPSIARIGETLMQHYEPILKDKTLKIANRDAANVTMERDEEGNLVLPEAESGGLLYRQAFDQLVQKRYLTEVGRSFQPFLDMDMAERRAGQKPFEPGDYFATVDGRKEGVLEGIDPQLRVAAEELFEREVLERKRAFVNEWSRNERQKTINGANDLIRFHLGELASFRDNNLTLEEATSRHIGPILELSEQLKNIGFIGDMENEALFLGVNKHSDGIVRYAESIAAASALVPAIGGMGLNEVQLLRYWMDGIEVDGKLSGLVYEGAGSEAVTPDLLRKVFREEFGFDPTSVERSADHSLSRANPSSHHNIANGGRAIDSKRIPGMTFEEYVATWKRMGFEVVEAIDEYESPSRHATGGHWHIALGNSRAAMKPVEIEGLKDFAREDAMALDPEVKRVLRNILTDREQVIRSEMAEARADAREQARAEAERRNTERIVNAVDGANAGGYGGHWNAEEKGVLNQRFDAQVNMDNIGSQDERARAVSFIQKNNYLPRQVVNYMENMLRSPDWKNVYQLYGVLQDATMANGARVGDMLLDNLETDTVTILKQVERMARAGTNEVQIEAFIERARSKDGFTVRQATEQANKVFRDAGKETYTVQRDRMLRESFGLADNLVLDPQVMGDVDQAFASNLDLVTRNPDKALSLAIEQVQGRRVKSGVFRAGVGPAGLLRHYTPQKIQNFLQSEKDQDGRPLLRRINGQMPVLGRSIKLQPADSNMSEIGRYMVYVYQPDNPTNIIDQFEIDLGRELREWSRGQAPGVSVDYIKRARDRREAEVESWRKFNGRMDRGPKY